MTETSYNPDDYTVDQVNEYLATADEDEKARVLAAEKDGQARKGIVGDSTGSTVQGNTGGTDDKANAPGLGSTGNSMDLATPGQDKPTANIAHADDAPVDITRAVDAAEEVGYIGVGAEGKPDYSQANPDVMNGEGS